MAKRIDVRTDQRSRVDNRGASFRNKGDVYTGPVNKTIIHDKSVTYDVDHEDTEPMERFSMWLMQHLGEKRTTLTAVLTFVLGGSSIVAWYKFAIVALFVLGVLLIFVAVALWTAIQYKYTSRCGKCNTFYAMREAGHPVEREVEVRGGVRRTTTRTFECKFCHDVVTKKSNRFIQDEPDPE